MERQNRTIEQRTHREGYFLHASLVQQVVDVNLPRLVRPCDHIRKNVGGGLWGGFAPLHRGPLQEGGGGFAVNIYQSLLEGTGTQFMGSVINSRLKLHWRRL